MYDLFAIAAGYSFATAAILGTGRAVVRRLGLAVSVLEELALCWIAGAALFSLAILALAAAHWIQPPVLAALGVGGIVAGWFAPPGRRLASPIPIPPAVVSAIFLAVYFVAALAPSLDSDGYRYHLGFPRLYIDAGGLIPVTLDFYSAFPQGIEMLYLFALAFGGFSVANLLHWNFYCALVTGVFVTGARLSTPFAGATAALAIAASSVIGTTAASASVDLALAAAVWISFHAWLRWNDDRSARGWLIAAAVAAGFACSVKYTGFTALLVSAVFVLRSPRAIPLAAAVAGACFIPWLFRNWIWFDNPVHPFLSEWFPNPYLLPYSERTWIEVVRSHNGASFNGSYPWDAAIRGVTAAGFAGPFFLVTPIALLALRTHPILLLCGAITALAWLLGNPIVRFAIPTMPFIALAVATSFGRCRTLLTAAAGLHAILCFPPFIERWNKQWIPAVKQIPWRQALRFESSDRFWYREIPSYAAARFLERHARPDARVLAFDDQPQFFTSRLLVNPYASEQASFADQLLRRAADGSSWPSVQCVVDLGGTPVSAFRLLQRNADAYAEWSIFEVLADLPPAALRAHPNPWDASLAGDGLLATPWSSKEPRRPGMWFEIGWNDAVPVKQIRYRTSPAHGGEVTFATSTRGGTWDTVGTRPKCSSQPLADFPRLAIAELRRRGWTHLMTGRDYPWLSQALGAPERWGLRPRYSERGVRILEIN
jgi:hypothetical protein